MAWRQVGMMVAGLLVSGMARADGDALAEAMSRNPDRFEARAVDLIAGFGGADGLRAEDIETHIALERAGARASGLRRFLAMDLDADGAVTRAELAVAQHAASECWECGCGKFEHRDGQYVCSHCGTAA